MNSRQQSAAVPQPTRIAGRYRVEEQLGRGGMAVVYRVKDSVTGREVALKQLLSSTDEKRQREAASLFEREFHTLAQLSHPRMIAVYDYGLDAGNAYYTMELLDGKDLRERAPVPWREACALLVGVCSSLALLHSRRLVHRDIGPRNIRCTRDGLAKLIDFGALAPMGSGGRVVGTPPFVAPEVVHRLALDARTDLFSLGATLYSALTGRMAYPARDFSELHEIWGVKPPPPSSIVSDIPPALDALVLSMISLEPALRPRTAFDVMQRLSALAGVECDEPDSVSQAYLATPVMVGRDALLDQIRSGIGSAGAGQGGGCVITGVAGAGRSRMLDACVLEAKTLGATVLRADASAGHGSAFAAAQALLEELIETLPADVLSKARDPLVDLELFEPVPNEGLRESMMALRPVPRDLTAADVDAPAAQAALLELFSKVTRKHMLVIAIDDLARIDEPSAALIAALADKAKRRHLLLAVTAESTAVSPALAIVADHCRPIELGALDKRETHELLMSVFGDVPNLELLSDRIYRVARGNPRETMDLAQHLVDKRLIEYDGGSWSLPSSLEASSLPNSADQVVRERVLALPELARHIIEAHALASHDVFTRKEYGLLGGDADSQQLDQALGALVSHALLIGDGRTYSLAHGDHRTALTAHLTPSERAERQRALAGMYERLEDRTLAMVLHLLAGERPVIALDRLEAFLHDIDRRGGLILNARLDLTKLGPLLERSLDAAEQLQRKPREINDIRCWLSSLSVIASDGVYFRAAPAWRDQLTVDSGLSIYREKTEIADPGERLKFAFETAFARYNATPEAERCYRPDEALKGLVQYVAISIAIGARLLDPSLVRPLPELLQPFIALSPLVDAMWQNAIATFEVNFGAQQERAHARVSELHARLDTFNETDLPNVRVIRNALAYCAGAIEATQGLATATKWAEILDQDTLQRVNGMHIRKIMRLQQGDTDGAERFRKQAEILAAQASWRQMFSRSFASELGAYAAAQDLTGVKQCMDGIEPLAQQWPGWVDLREAGEGHFQRLRGNLEAALSAYDRCLALCSPDPAQPDRSVATWPRATACKIEVLVELGRCEEAKALGERTLAIGRERDVVVAMYDVSRALALAEAKLGDYPVASARLTEVIAKQRALGITGLNLGASYEARARIAIWAGDNEMVEEFARLTAQEYRHGRGSPLGALYEKLMAEARRAGVKVPPQLSEFESTMMATTNMGYQIPAALKVKAALGRAASAADRAACALTLICNLRGAHAGHLYLLREQGLSLAASEKDGDTTDGLLDFVNDFMTRELEDAEVATAIASEHTTEFSPRSAIWTDPNGFAYEPLLLTCVMDGEPRCVGVAVLTCGARERQGNVMEVVNAIGTHLIEAGDARAIAARI